MEPQKGLVPGSLPDLRRGHKLPWRGIRRYAGRVYLSCELQCFGTLLL